MMAHHVRKAASAQPQSWVLRAVLEVNVGQRSSWRHRSSRTSLPTPHEETNQCKDDASNQPEEPNADLLLANQDRQIAVGRIDAEEQNHERYERKQGNNQHSGLVIEARALSCVGAIGIGKR